MRRISTPIIRSRLFRFIRRIAPRVMKARITGGRRRSRGAASPWCGEIVRSSGTESPMRPPMPPDAVKRAIWAANGLRRMPYKWGGGHGSFSDTGYDCSGTVSYALHFAGLLDSPVSSSDLLNFGQRGRGRWITIYCRNGHTFAMIAGLRLDTTGDYGTEGPRWHADGREGWGFEARHPAGL